MIKKIYRKIFKYIQRAKLKNHNFTIICDSCVGGVICSELNEAFYTPTINLSMNGRNFIRFLKNIELYLSQEIIEVNDSGCIFPVGRLLDINLYFVHSDSFHEAKQQWDKRKVRMNYSNLFIVMTENDGCNYSELKDFDELQFKNKVVFTHIKYPEINSAFYIKGFESANEIGNIIEYETFYGKRYYDQFSWVKWLNQKNNQK